MSKPVFCYDKKLYNPNWNKNTCYPDSTNIFYIDSNPTGSSGTISSKNTEFTSFTYSNTKTKFCDWDSGNDSTGNGTFANPYKSLNKALTMLDNTFYQICLLTDSGNIDTLLTYDGTYYTRWLNNGALTVTDIRIFAKGNTTPIIGGIQHDAFKNYMMQFWNLNSGTAANIRFYNLFFNFYTYNVDPSYNNWFEASTSSPVVQNYIYFCAFLKSDFLNGINYFYNDDYNYSFHINYNPNGSAASLNLKNSFIKFSPLPKNQILKYTNSIENNIIINCNSNTISFNDKNLTKNIFYNCPLAENIGGTNTGNIFYNSFIPAGTNTYNCSNNILLSGTENVKSNPLFISSDPILPEDFQLQTILAGFPYNSPCLFTGNAGGTENIGAWQSDTTGIKQEAYRKYELENNCKNVLIPESHVDISVVNTLSGKPLASKKNDKRTIEFTNNENTMFTSNDKYTLDYISGIMQDNIDYRVDEILDILLFFELTTGILTGTMTAYNSSTKIMTVSENFTELNKWRGFQLWQIHESQTGASINASTKVISGLTGLTVDDYIGFWVYDSISKMIYKIIDNDTTSITVYDPFNYLTATTSTAAVKIYKSFKIKKNIFSEITIIDDDNEFSSTKTTYIIQEIIMRSVTGDPKYSETGFRNITHSFPVRNNNAYKFQEK